MIRLACLFFTVALVGCSASTRTTPVTGVVVLDGKPLAGAAIQFVPQGAGRDATGETDAKGEFVMSTFQPRDGVMAGDYKVVISAPTGAIDTTQHATSEDAMAAAAKSKPAAKSTFPAKYTRADQTPLTQTVPVQGSLKFELSSK